MATRKVKLKGLAYWSKVFPENRDLTGFEDALKDVGGQCTIDVDLDEDNMALLKKSKSMLTGRPSPDNPKLTRVKFKRKWEENFGGGAPDVFKADGTTWSLEDDGLIGNGSEVIVVLSVYDTSRARIVGTRLEKLKVTKHLIYTSDFDDDDGDDEMPAPKKEAKKPAASVPVPEMEDDEIPF